VYDSGRDHFLVNIREPALVAVVDAETAAVVGGWSVPSAGPHGLDLDTAGERLFTACDGGELICLSSADGHQLGTVQIAGEPDAIWFDADAGSLYVATGRPGVVEVVDTDRIAVADTLVTQEGAHTTALDIQRRMLYIFKPISCSVAAFRIV